MGHSSSQVPSRGGGGGQGTAGQALAEFAIVLVVLMLIVLGVFDLSRAVYIHSAVTNAAREGARYAVVHPGANDAQVTQQAKALVAGFDPGAVEVIVNPATPDAEHLQVIVTYTFYPATGLIAKAAGLGEGGIQLQGKSVMRVEAQ